MSYLTIFLRQSCSCIVQAICTPALCPPPVIELGDFETMTEVFIVRRLSIVELSLRPSAPPDYLSLGAKKSTI